MGKTTQIIFAGNCQALAMGSVYARHIAPLLDQHVTILDLHPSLPPGQRLQRLQELRTADIVVEQIFDPPRLVPPDSLPTTTRHATFPTTAGAFYWPFSQSPHPRNEPGPLVGSDGAYPGEIGCRQLNHLIQQELPAEEILRRYAGMDLAALARLDRFLELHLDGQKRRDAMAGLDTHDFIKSRLRTEKLFLTAGHPDLPLFGHVAEGLFEKLGVPYSLTEATLRAQRISPFPFDEAPIHPSVAAHLGLSFVDEKSTYRHRHDGAFTFEAFTLRYITYQWDRDLAEGMQLFHANQAARAVPSLRDGLRACPNSIAGWRSLGLALAALGETEAGIAAVDRAIALDPADPEGQATAAHIWLRAGDLARAERCARAAIKIFPLWPGSHRVLAHILAGRGDHRAAFVTAKWAFDLAPGDQHNIAFLDHFRSTNPMMPQEPASRAARSPPLADAKPRPEKDHPITSIVIDFGANGTGHEFLGEGWSHPEPETTWTVGVESTIHIPLMAPDQDYALLFSAYPACADTGHAHRAIFHVNDTVIGNLILRSETSLELLVPRVALAGKAQATLRIGLPDAISPAQIGDSADRRLLGLAFRYLSLHPFSQSKISGGRAG